MGTQIMARGPISVKDDDRERGKMGALATTLLTGEHGAASRRCHG